MAFTGSNVFTGAKLEMTVGGTVVAYANNATFTLNHNHQPIEVFGKPQVDEYAELGTTVEFSASQFRIAKTGAVQQGLMPTLQSFLNQPSLQVVIKEAGQDGRTLVTVTNVKCTSRSMTVDARGVMTETLNFVGIELVETAN